jgi:hypothetical protein
MSNVGTFSAQVASFGQGTMAKVEKIRRGVVLKLFGAVIMDTPVLTGRLRGNWQCSEGTPVLDALDSVDPNGGPTVAMMNQVVEKSKGGDVAMFLTNNLPYAARIEYDGWSHTKQPEGMVRKNVVRFNGLIKAEIAA